MHPMYQRQRIERGRQAPANNGAFWPREADSQTRNFSACGKGDEGRYPSASRRMEGDYDHIEMEDGWQNGYHGEPKRVKTTCWGDQEKALKHSSQPVIVRKVEHHNPLINRPNGKLVRVRSLRLKPVVPIIKNQEPEVRIMKKQEIETNRPLPSDDYCGKEEIALDEKKWMYRNEHGKMCGPYPLRQLMEGLDARFLPEDLLIREVHRGDLGQPMKLKQLVVEARGQKGEMAGSRWGYSHSPTWPVLAAHRQDPHNLGSHSKSSFMPPLNNSQGWPSCDSSLTDVREPPLNKHPTSPWNSQKHQCSDYSPGSDPLVWASEETFGRVMENNDIPPAFENSVNHFSERDGHVYSPPFLSTSAARTDVLCHPSSPGFLDEDLPEPPGFGAHTKGRCSGHPEVPMASTNEGVQCPYSSFGKMNTNLYDQNGTSEQVSSCHNSSRSMQGAKNFSRADALPYAQTTAHALNHEVQAFPPPPISPPPVVCIGLPVSMPGAQPHPRSALWPQQVNVITSPKDKCGFTLGHVVDPLTMIQHELLSAVSSSYVKSVLSATIGEHLEYWLRAGKVGGKALASEQGIFSTPQLLSREDIGNIDQVKDSTQAQGESHAQGIGPPLARGMEKSASSSESADASFINSVSEQREEPHHPPIIMSASDQHEEHYCSLSKASNADNMSNTCISIGLPILSEVDNTLSDKGKCIPSLGKAEDWLDFGKSNSCVRPRVEGPSPPSNVIHDPGQARQKQSDGQTVMDALVEIESCSLVRSTNQELPCSVPRKERDHVKYMEQLLVMASKLKRREKKKSLALTRKKKKAGIRKTPEVLDRKQGVDLAHADQEGSAWTRSDGWSQHNQAGHAHQRCDEMDDSTGMDAPHDSFDIRSETQVAQAAGADVQTLALYLQATKKKLQLARSSLHHWGICAVETIEAGDFVIEYVGEFVRAQMSNIEKCQYEEVDAKKCGGLARFINHSCNPNCVAKVIGEEGCKKVLLYSKRDIRAGEELTYDYDVHNGGEQRRDCTCGFARCRKSLNSRSIEEAQPEAVEPYDITCS